jgi:transposase
VFIDETWLKTNMARSHGRCRRGQRLIAKVPHARWITTTFFAAMRRTEMFAPMVIEGPVNAAVFTAYVEQCLGPKLKPGETVALDNLGSHKGQAAAQAIEQAKAKLAFLPAYSPDFNPIEPGLGQIKSHLRKAAKRTTKTLWNAAGKAIDKVTPDNCANYFKTYGYGQADRIPH